MHSKSLRAMQAGFSLIEILVVLVLLGIIAGFAIPAITNQFGGAQHKAAKTQITRIQQGIDTFYFDVGRFPNSVNDLVDQPGDASGWNGPYIQKKMAKDPWGNEWQYKQPGEHGDYDVVSYGKDGNPGGEGQSADITSWD